PTCWQIISSLDKTPAAEREREFIGPGDALSWLNSGTGPRDTELRATEGRSRPLPVVMQFAQQWEPQWAKGPT
ncbi:hypothetical protein X777_13347, partial [Ooceraea biroi]